MNKNRTSQETVGDQPKSRRHLGKSVLAGAAASGASKLVGASNDVSFLLAVSAGFGAAYVGDTLDVRRSRRLERETALAIGNQAALTVVSNEGVTIFGDPSSHEDSKVIFEITSNDVGPIPE